jgi:hypothetical protein
MWVMQMQMTPLGSEAEMAALVAAPAAGAFMAYSMSCAQPDEAGGERENRVK